jgi:hypothetical protein
LTLETWTHNLLGLWVPTRSKGFAMIGAEKTVMWQLCY